VKPHEFLAGGSTSAQAGPSQQQLFVSRTKTPSDTPAFRQSPAAPQNAVVTVLCRTWWQERKVGEMSSKRDGSSPLHLCQALAGGFKQNAACPKAT